MNYIWDDIMNEDEVESSLFQFNGSTFTEALIEGYIPNTQTQQTTSSLLGDNETYQEGNFLNFGLSSSTSRNSQTFFNYPQVTSTTQYHQVPSTGYTNNSNSNTGGAFSSINPKALQYSVNSPPPSPFFFADQDSNNIYAPNYQSLSNNNNNFNNNNFNNNSNNNESNNNNNIHFLANSQSVKIQPKQEEFGSPTFFTSNTNNYHYMPQSPTPFQYDNNNINNSNNNNNSNFNNILSPNKKNKNDNKNLSAFQPNVKMQKTSNFDNNNNFTTSTINNNNINNNNNLNFGNDKFNLNGQSQFQNSTLQSNNSLCQFGSSSTLEIKVEEHPPVEVRTRTPGENRTFALKGVVMGNFKALSITSISVVLEYALASRDTKDDRPKQSILGGTKMVSIGNEGVFRFENLCMTEASTKHTEKEFCLHFVFILSTGKEIPSHCYTSPFYAYSHKKVLNRRKNISLRATSKQFGPISGGGEIHLVGTPFIKGPSLKILFKTPNGNVEIKYSDGGVERYSETVLFFDLPPYPHPSANLLRDEIQVEILVTNDGRNYSNPLFFTYLTNN